jgi:hypothetical protein
MSTSWAGSSPVQATRDQPAGALGPADQLGELGTQFTAADRLLLSLPQEVAHPLSTGLCRFRHLIAP